MRLLMGRRVSFREAVTHEQRHQDGTTGDGYQ
jgi:hypothetical protein